MRSILALVFFFILATGTAQPIAPLWQNFVQAKQTGGTPILPDFSYAGYHFSESPLPDLSGKRYFNVTDYGAHPDDNRYDDEGIQAAIWAAEQNPGGGVVFFPPGKFMIAPDEDRTKFIRITKSNIVLKGSGKGDGGTVIFQDNMRVGSKQFQFKPGSLVQHKLTTIVKDAPQESFWVEVAEGAKLAVGQGVVIRHKSEAYTRHYFSPLTLKAEWSRLFGDTGGMGISEIHTVEKIEGNRVKFKNPIHYEIKQVPGKPFELETFTSMRECGIEDILFTGNWSRYPETFVHHKDGVHDGGWNMISMEYVEDSWIRNCEFRHLNECIFIRAGYKVTIQDCSFTGKKGHTSVHARTGYGVLIKHCRFNGSHHHGPGTGYSASNTVITQCEMGIDQNIDLHSGQPIATLFDDILGGVFTNLGGPLPGHPHHGKNLVMWNFRHRSEKDYYYNFWDETRRRNFTIAQPLFIGFQANTTVTFEHAGMDQLRGTVVEPRSLFEAQLKARVNKDVAGGAR